MQFRAFKNGVIPLERAMGKLLEGIGQLIIGLNYIFSSFLVLGSYGLFWGLVSFFVPPVGAVIAPFIVNTWGFFFVGALLFILGTAITSRSDKKLSIQLLEYERNIDRQLAKRIQDAEIVGQANALKVFLNEPIAGPGKLIGSPNGHLFWSGDSGVSFNIEDNIESWGRSEFGKNTDKFYFRTTSLKEFEISEAESNLWRKWFSQHYPTRERT